MHSHILVLYSSLIHSHTFFKCNLHSFSTSLLFTHSSTQDNLLLYHMNKIVLIKVREDFVIAKTNGFYTSLFLFTL